MTTKLLDTISANADGDVVNTQRRYNETGIFQVEITGAASVALQGRLSPTAPWFTVTTLTSSDAQFVSIFPQMRAVVSGYSSGDVNAWLSE